MRRRLIVLALLALFGSACVHRSATPGTVTLVDGSSHDCADLVIVYEPSIFGADRLDRFECFTDPPYGETYTPTAVLSYTGGRREVS